MKYKGFTYSEEKDYEPDNVKIFHSVITPDGKEVLMDWSPYSSPSEADFQLWIDLGMPDRMHSALGKRQAYCPLNRDNLFKIRADVMSLLIIGV